MKKTFLEKMEAFAQLPFNSWYGGYILGIINGILISGWIFIIGVLHYSNKK